MCIRDSDDVSEGRLDLGLGPGSEGFDASALGQKPWEPAERMARFEEFLEVLRPILDGEPSTRTSLRTAHYAAAEAPSTPGTVQRPLPLTVAAGGPSGLRLAATHGSQWVTIGPTGRVARTPASVLEAVRRQRALLDAACESVGRDVSSIGKVLLWTPTEPVIDSAARFEDLSGPYAELGFDEFVVHHPAQTGPYGGDLGTFEEIATSHAEG